MKTKILLMAFIACLGFSTGSYAQAKTWKSTHPRRVEVNTRLRNESKRIHTDVKSGKMSKTEAKQLRKRERSILRQERKDAAKHGGHLTKKEQRRLNKRENNVSKAIGK